MKWEEIDEEAKRVVARTTARLTEAEEVGQPDEARDMLARQLSGTDLLEEEAARREKYDYLQAFQQIHRLKRRLHFRYIAAAAAVLVVALGSVGIWWETRKGTPIGTEYPSGSHQVTLRLSDGRTVALPDQETLQVEDGDKTIKVQNGGVNYAARPTGKAEKSGRSHTLSVPRSAEYRLVLADGTRVHLNAASQLKYPVSFSGEKREVYLQGEAWFEVAEDVSRPFYVHAEGVQIRVYGTRFNVNTYKFNTIETVLVEGSIGIQAEGEGQEIRMQPGQLAEMNRESKNIQLKEVDVRQYTAWKEGIFYFNDDTLEDILNELARWYDREVFFHSNRVKELHFTGHLARYEDIRKILNTVTESTGVEFQVTDKTIIVK